MSILKGTLPSIFGKSEAGKPNNPVPAKPPEAGPATAGIAHHFSSAVERRAPVVADTPRPVPPPPAPDTHVRFPMWCSVTGKPFVVVARRDGKTLRMLRNEPVTGGGGGAADMPNLGSFVLDYAEWPGCLHCKATINRAHNMDGFWQCSKSRCGGPFHCVGNPHGFCACGLIDRRTFYVEHKFSVRGAAREAAAAAAMTTAATPVPNATAATLRIGRK